MMENTGIKRYEDYTENCENHYRLPNTSTMENLSMKVYRRRRRSAEDGR